MGGPENNQNELSSLPPLPQEFTDRQDLDIHSPAVVAVAAGLALLAFQLLLPLLAPLLSGVTSTSLEKTLIPLLPPLSVLGLPTVALTREERPMLQNHPRCGITTGGQVCV